MIDDNQLNQYYGEISNKAAQHHGRACGMCFACKEIIFQDKDVAYTLLNYVPTAQPRKNEKAKAIHFCEECWYNFAGPGFMFADD